SEGELELHLAGQHTTELLDHQFLHPLEQLDERMQALAAALGVPGRRPCPVRPQAAVAAFVGLFGAEDLTRGLRPLVFNQFDKRLPEVLGDLYEKLNDLLEAAGFGSQSGSNDRGTRSRGGGGGPSQVVAANAAAAAPNDAGWVPDGGVVEHIGGGGGGAAGGGESPGVPGLAPAGHGAAPAPAGGTSAPAQGAGGIGGVPMGYGIGAPI